MVRPETSAILSFFSVRAAVVGEQPSATRPSANSVRWLDNETDEKHVLIAAGGTALTLQNARTKDVGFVVHNGNLDALKEICSKSDIRIDLFESGFVFNNPLSWICRAKQKTGLNNITLDRTGVIMTKTARAGDHDIEDITSCKTEGITADDIYKMMRDRRSRYAQQPPKNYAGGV